MGYKVNYNSVIYEVDGRKVAFIEYPEYKNGVVNITHTYVTDSLRGNGVAGLMMKLVVDHLDRTNRKAKVTCSYAIEWFKKNPSASKVLYKVD